MEDNLRLDGNAAAGTLGEVLGPGLCSISYMGFREDLLAATW
jgi:hypothetical protein